MWISKMSCLFLIRPDLILDLIGIRDKEKFIYELVQKETLFDKEISLRTFKNFMNMKGSPSQKTINVLQEYFQIDLESDIFKSLHNSLWNEMLTKIQLTFPEDFFPYAMSILKDIAEQEDSLIQEMKKCTTELERIQVYAHQPFVLQMLNEQEIQTLYNAKNHKEIKITSVLLITKTLFYIVVAFDVEYGLYHQQIHKEDQYSFIKKILPKFNEKNEFLHPIDRFFTNIKVKNKKTFQEMAECINVEGYKEIKSESQIRKFRMWRKGNKIPYVDEVVNMVKRLFPQISTRELDHAKVMFYCVVGVSTFFKQLLNAKSNGQDMFKNDLALIDWLNVHYAQYHQEHYKAYLTSDI